MVRNKDARSFGRAWILLCLVALLAVGCQRRTTNEPITQSAPEQASEVTNRRTETAAIFNHILERLWDSDESVRAAGMKDLADFQQKMDDPGSEVGLKALRAAARPYLFENPEPSSVSAELVAVAYSTPQPEYIPVVVELFDKFSDDGKSQAQAIITGLESREAAEAFMTIVRTYAPTGKLHSLVAAQLVNKPRHVDVLFPEILTYASNPQLSFEIYGLCLAYCEAKLLRPEVLAPYTEQVLKSYTALAAKLRSAQKDQGIDWMWEESYEEPRHEAALLLDLLGYFPSDFVEKPLREAVEFKDPRLKYFALISLLHLGKSVDEKDVNEVASHAEVRNWLHIKLKQMGKSSLFPEKFRTQSSFAESDMVNWLIYPTELNRVPGEIELMKVVTVDTGMPDGIYDYYLFRFRTNEPHWAAKSGWMAGVSGPFARKEQPTTDALGDTFSSFTKWDSMTPDEHVGDIRELTRRWREYHSKKKKLEQLSP